MKKIYNISVYPEREKLACYNHSCNGSIKLYYQEGENIGMSLVFVYKSDSRIVLASDSRSLRRINDNINYIDGFKKIIYLKNADIAFITAGPNVINDQNITDFLLSNEEYLIGKSLPESLNYLSKEINNETFTDESVLLICANRFKDRTESYSINITNKIISEIEETSCLWHNGSQILNLSIVPLNF